MGKGKMMKKIRIKHKAILLTLLMVLSSAQLLKLEAADSPWTRSNRIAISADGNPDADADDVGATPFTLAVLAKAGLQDNLVHYDFNNFLEYKKIEPGNNRMWLGAMGGKTRWGFDRSRFFDDSIDPDGAVEHLTAEINKSTAVDPLYLVVAGPMELIYRALVAADEGAIEHVILVSHHNYNEYHKPRLWQRNWNDIQAAFPQVGYLRIKDQNGWNGSGLKGKNHDDADFYWLRDHADPNLNWVYDRIVAGKPDVSDAGIITWLIGINGTDEAVTVSEMKTWFGNDPIPTHGGSSNAPNAPAGVQPEVIPPVTETIFEEVNGRIVIEAESTPLTDHWVLDSKEPGTTGAGAIRWMPPKMDEISNQHQGVLIYKLRITNPGTYRMALKSSPQRVAEKDTLPGCFTLMGLDIAPWGMVRKTHNLSGENGLSWQTIHGNYGVLAREDGKTSVPSYELEAGDHYFWICGRSGGFLLDKIHFVKEGVSGFKDDSLNPTPVVPHK